MGLKEILNMDMSNILAMLVLGSLVIEITPIKINPLKSIFKWLGKQINGSVTEELNSKYDEIIKMVNDNQNTINDLVKDFDVQSMETWRWAILKFAGDIRTGTPRSRDEYKHIFDVSNKYHHLIDKHNLKNGLIDTEMALIEKRYKEHCEKNDFLK